MVFSGVGKSEDEIRAALETGILCFNIESDSELERSIALLEGSERAPISLRVIPTLTRAPTLTSPPV